MEKLSKAQTGGKTLCSYITLTRCCESAVKEGNIYSNLIYSQLLVQICRSFLVSRQTFFRIDVTCAHSKKRPGSKRLHPSVHQRHHSMIYSVAPQRGRISLDEMYLRYRQKDYAWSCVLMVLSFNITVSRLLLFVIIAGDALYFSSCW